MAYHFDSGSCRGIFDGLISVGEMGLDQKEERKQESYLSIQETFHLNFWNTYCRLGRDGMLGGSYLRIALTFLIRHTQNLCTATLYWSLYE